MGMSNLVEKMSVDDRVTDLKPKTPVPRARALTHAGTHTRICLTVMYANIRCTRHARATNPTYGC
jgi:hypothetical protein